MAIKKDKKYPAFKKHKFTAKMYVVPKTIMDKISNKAPKLLAKVWKIKEAIPIKIIAWKDKNKIYSFLF